MYEKKTIHLFSISALSCNFMCVLQMPPFMWAVSMTKLPNRCYGNCSSKAVQSVSKTIATTVSISPNTLIHAYNVIAHSDQ